MIYPVIIAGGKGERFWPYSNSVRPKQLLPLVTDKTMLEDTLTHIKKIKTKAPVFIITSKSIEKQIKKLSSISKEHILIGEPCGRDTAAAIGLACKLISRLDPQGVMVVLTADHAISPSQKLATAVKGAYELAKKENTLVTFGIRPTRPEVGYGYIETGAVLKSVFGLECRKVKQFHEKPGLATARKYLHSRKYFWNSGMFAWRVDYLWELFQQFLPEIYNSFEKVGVLKHESRDFSKKLTTIYSKLQKESIDYGIMEKAPNISLIVPDFSWDDIGSWTSLDRLYKMDDKGNVKIGENVELETRNTTFFSDSGLIAAYGVENLLIVQHKGVTLVVDKNKRSQLKKLVELVGKNKKLAKYL